MQDIALSPKRVVVGDHTISNDTPFTLIAGPCQIQSLDHALETAERISGICEGLGLELIYKSSFDKANRSSIDTPRGVGMDEGLAILDEVRKRYNTPVLTDVHEAGQCAHVAEVCEVLQIPAFLSRQTDLLLAAAETGAAINVKKGQFMAPWDMKNVADKIASTGNERIMLCDRGTSFGYNTLVTDFRGLPIMGETGYPVIFDATHSVQQPGGNGTTSGGQRQFVKTLASAATAIGVAGLFIETHEDPDTAPSDGPNMIPLDQLEALLEGLVAFDGLAKI
ncbi:3-deoxy-8-phosphooctulonate synthase [Salipiger mucosus]|uniref:2-dehydro-3-deoxyphosphooctonate aldolase n=1 Tax=Salipiger mucosus DSM 16094 TaxID=1123237 RepID=S9RVH9_9RHOB|nr:3-deoxy-8-phosphooctulonate synthase [Salipiger mucosus]EPX77984.1 2-Keto-3-deoxy-D-manno-octulosonate-8-phosphate synthase [Salipiger mucosus DSM 16094]